MNAAKTNFINIYILYIYILYIYILYILRLQGECLSLQDLIFILNCSRVSEFFTARGSMSYILGPRYLRALKAQLTVFINPN